MGFIGKVPTPVPLTSSDITDGIVTTAKIADANITTAKIANDAVDENKLDLTADYAFTGSISGAGSLNLISTTTISTGVGTVDITSGFDSTYDNYLIILQGITNSTDDALLEMQLHSSAGSPDTTSGAYRHAADGRRDNGDARATNSNTSNTMRLGNQVNGNQSDEVLEGEIYIHNVNSTTKRQIINYHIGSLQSDSAICHITGSAQYTNSGVAITGVRFLMSAGNITGGKIKLYGIS